MSAARRRHRELLREVVVFTDGDNVPDALSWHYAELFGHDISPLVFRWPLHNFDDTLQSSITHLLEIIPVTHRAWFPSDVVAELLPHGDASARRIRIDEHSSLIVVDPLFLWMLEAISMALMSQIDCGDGEPRDRDKAARAIHTIVAQWVAGEMPFSREDITLTKRQIGHGSQITRRAFDFCIAHEIGHMGIESWDGPAKVSLPIGFIDDEWQFEHAEVSETWTRELWADSIACWLLSHSALDTQLHGSSRDDVLPPIYGGAALAMSIAQIAEEASQSTPVTELYDGAIRRLVWDQSSSHPAAMLRASEINKFLDKWMGRCAAAQQVFDVVAANIRGLWLEGNAS